MLKKAIIITLCLAIFIPSLLSAKQKAKGGGSSKDSEWDPYGNTCKANEKCTFTKRDTLPGGIPVEVNIISLGSFKGNVDKVFDYAFGDLRRVASILNDDDPSSEISQVNANAGKGFIEVGPEFIQLITAAKKAFLWTNGAFDITATPDIGNFNNIKIAGKMVLLKKKGMKISLDNIISGYIADLLIRAIYNANIDQALVNVGNTSRGLGTSVVGSWRTQIDDGEGRYARRGMTIDISNVSVASVIRGKNAPVIDPRWNTPIAVTPRNVTIIARNAAIAEALAHGIYVLGPEKGLVLIGTLQNIKGVIVDTNGNFIKAGGIQ